MRILFDQGVPAPLRSYQEHHGVDTLHERGWSTLSNGDLLDRAEADGHELLITTDQNLCHQKNLVGRQLAILVLLAASWPPIQHRVDGIRAAVDLMGPGMYAELEIPISR